METPTEMRTLVKCRTALYTECYSCIYHGSSPVYLLLSACVRATSWYRLQTGVPSPPHLAPRTPVSPLWDTLLAALAASMAATLPVHSYSAHCGLATCRIILIAGSRYFIKCMLSCNPITSVLCMSGLKYCTCYSSLCNILIDSIRIKLVGTLTMIVMKAAIFVLYNLSV